MKASVLVRPFMVAGTAAGVGKTLVTSAIVRALRGVGVEAVAMKAVARGVLLEDGSWHSAEMELLAAASAFTFARPKAHPPALTPQPHAPLPYAKATYSARDAQRAFRSADIKLVRRTHEPVPVGDSPIIDLSNSGNIVEVDVFGNPQRVAASGFSNQVIPKTCTHGAKAAQRWSGNVRAIVDCTAAGTSAPAWVARVDRALAKLS